MRWLWTSGLLVASVAAAEEGSDPCRSFRAAPDRTTGEVRLVRRATRWSVDLGDREATWTVTLQRVGTSDAALPAGAPVDVVLADGARLRLSSTTTARPVHQPSKTAPLTWWTVELPLSAEAAAFLGRGGVAEVRAEDVDGVAHPRRRRLEEALRCVDQRLAVAERRAR